MIPSQKGLDGAQLRASSKMRVDLAYTNTHIRSEIFQKYGFTVESNDKMTTLIPPIISASSALGQFNRARVVRGWLEVMAWLDYYSQRFSQFAFLRLSHVN